MAKTPEQQPPANPPLSNPGGEQPKPEHENPIEHLAEEVESHLIEAGEMATSTTSAETNIVLAALGAIEGPRAPKAEAEKKQDGGKKRKPRPKAR